ncbi:putative microtubule-associated protein [[Mycoplasma] phocae]|uniref:Putative microtubule-associated protein n=2 Tax=[Mycoplasma] phocae TaxID=142651 RepID=A0A2Z5IQE0_9BACT|nr:putative microtubule-associated protein [[Mycoplasma] phocae]
MSIIEQIRSEFSAMDFVELYREVYLKKIPEASPFVKKIVENVLNGVLKPIDLGKEFINKFKEYINSNEKNTEFEDIITKLLLDNPVDGRYYPFIFLLEYTSSSFTNFSNPSENSEYYISLFKKYWDQLISLKNSDFLNYQYLYYLKKSLSNYNNDKANKFYNNRQNVEISLAIEKIIDKAISNKSLLSEMDVQEINTLFKKAEGLIKY